MVHSIWPALIIVLALLVAVRVLMVIFRVGRRLVRLLVLGLLGSVLILIFAVWWFGRHLLGGL